MNEPLDQRPPLVIVVMGVSGCGKSTIAEYIAHRLDAHFKDGDELHPRTNIEKMEAGIPLSDDDRDPWLLDVARYAKEKAAEHGVCVIACSALKRRYRATLNTAGEVVYVFLNGTHELIAGRMRARKGHFMPDTLLDSQFATLEDPRNESNVIEVSIEADAPSIAASAVEKLAANGYISTLSTPS